MVYRKFYINLVIRIILIILTGLLFIPFILSARNFLFSYITLGMVFGGQLILLLHYTGRINRNIERFFLSVREQNLSISFSDMSHDSGFNELNDYFHEINEIVSRVKREKEMQWRYLHYVVENIDVGILATDRRGKVELWNRAASGILGIEEIKNIDRLKQIESDLPGFLTGLKPGKSVLRKITINGQVLPVSFKASVFSMEEKEILLVSFQNIKNELEDNELDSWQKLIRVLTHEIMNSVAPISSLSATLKWRYNQSGAVDGITQDDSLYDDTVNALRIIESRSKGLIGFLGNYRKLTRLPRLNISNVDISELFQDLLLLMKQEADNAGVIISVRLPGSETKIKADRKLIEQILINLVKNAIQSFDDRPDKTIELRTTGITGLQSTIQVANNGPEIPGDVMDKIFIPFFTTRENGSGIGLSFARQIMRLHGGNISASSQPGGETVFNLNF